MAAFRFLSAGRRPLALGAAAALILIGAVVACLWPGGQERRTFKGHGGPVWAVACAADGPLLATGSEDGTVRLWDAESGSSQANLEGHRGGVHAVAFAPRGALLATGGDDRSVKLWDVAGRRELASLTGHTDGV